MVTSSARATRQRVSSDGFPSPLSIVARLVFEMPARDAAALKESPRASRCARISRATRVVTTESCSPYEFMLRGSILDNRTVYWYT
jgi:hypothetical protein